MPKICFVSDLHLFARRSTAGLHLDRMVEVAEDCQYFILGGDIFDFRWSSYASDEATADAAVDWLRMFSSRLGHCEVHFVFGNHDDHPLLHNRLPQLELELEKFRWSRFYLRLGNTLFLHGDVADRTTTAALLEQRRNAFQHTTRTPLQHKLYDLAVKARLHQLAPPARYPRKRVARRILQYMEHIGHGPQTGVEHVCFGHTHRSVDHYLLENVTFHNCGAAIGVGKFRVVKREVVIPEQSIGG